jgi:putative DNA primase/helicase
MAEPSNIRSLPRPDMMPLSPRARRVADVVPTTIDWLCRGRIAAGKITVLDGDPGLGKSTIALDWAARLTTGRALPGMPGWETNESRARARGVVLLSAEDGESDTIRPRLDGAGADCKRVILLKMSDESGNEYLPTLGQHLYAIEQQIEAADAAMLIIDPLMAYLESEVNANRDQDVRRVLSPVASMAERTGCAVIVLRHLNKAVGMASLYRGGGSIGIIGAARVGLLAHKNNDDETGQERFLMVQKCNIGPEATTLVYRIVGIEGTETSRVEWLGESSVTASSVMGQPVDPTERQELTDAEKWLADALSTGPITANDIYRDGRKDGYSDKTLRRAKSKLGIDVYREGYGKEGGWFWRLPPELVAHAHAREGVTVTPHATTVDDGWQ